MYLRLYFLSILILISSCAKNQDNIISISTFNIKWLGDGIDDKVNRTIDDYKRIAEVINDLDSDIIALQEIENEDAIKKITNHLPEYSYQIVDDGYVLNLAYLYKNYIELKNAKLYQELKVINGRTRSGLIAEASKGNFDFYLMNLHLKSTSRWDNTPRKKAESFQIRESQASVLSNWTDSILKFSEKDLIIVGDYNDNQNRGWSESLRPLENNDNLEFLSSNLESCYNPQWDNIDHILVSKSAHKRYIMGSVGMHSIYSAYPENEAKKISDHCPVTAIFEIASPDND